MRKNDDIIAIYSVSLNLRKSVKVSAIQVELCKEYVRVHYGDTR